ncbi:MAG: hypothetical protein J6V12_04835 [Bacteroidaceae bacterium]|nr:hypothetical protein [Bacteroidaceae bacterium]
MKTKMFLFVATIAMIMTSCGSSKKSQNDQMMMMMMQMMQQQQNQGGQQQQQQQPAQAASEIDEKVAEWKAQGYQLTGAYSTFTMKSLLEKHNQKAIDTERYVALQGTGIGSEVSDSRMYAMNDAAINYATAAGSVVSGGITRQFSNMGTLGNKLMGAYTQKVAEFVTPYLRESFTLYRKQGTKTEVVVYYIIDQENAYAVRKNAMDEALRETATEQVFGAAVDEWVKEFVSDVPQE